MKKIFFMATLLFGSIAFSCTKCQDPPNRCIDESRIRKDVFCPAVYDPVCGCNGVTYGNSCEAENSGVIKWTKGACNSTGKE